MRRYTPERYAATRYRTITRTLYQRTAALGYSTELVNVEFWLAHADSFADRHDTPNLQWAIREAQTRLTADITRRGEIPT